MIPHPLDRPVWSALTTRQRAVALGDPARALRYDPAYGLFAAAVDESGEGLAALVPEDGVVAIVEPEGATLPPGLAVVRQAVCDQMVLDALAPAAEPAFDIVPLGEAEAEEMLSLATLTVPGPFFQRTHRLGRFVGVKVGGRLVAMAGERMQPPGFTEVSGVCTHPDHRGRGYAAALIRTVAAAILDRGETPVLHTYADNAGAITLYRALGFRRRRALVMTTLSRRSSR